MTIEKDTRLIELLKEKKNCPDKSCGDQGPGLHGEDEGFGGGMDRRDT
nr:hypothetical protein [Methanobacterium formicicum]